MKAFNIFFSFWHQNSDLSNFTSRVFSYLQPWQQKALNCSANYTASFVSQAKQEIRLLSARDGIKKHLVSSVLSNPILTPSHIPKWGCAAPQNRLGNSTNDLVGKSQRAAITCSFANVPLLHWARVWFLSGRPSFFVLSLHFYPLLILPSVLSSLLLFFPLWVSTCCPVCLCYLLSLGSATIPTSHLHLLLFQFKLRVSWLCVSCRNASSDCILHPQCSNKASVRLPPPFSSPFFIPFVAEKWAIAAVNTKSSTTQREKD